MRPELRELHAKQTQKITVSRDLLH